MRTLERLALHDRAVVVVCLFLVICSALGLAYVYATSHDAQMSVRRGVCDRICHERESSRMILRKVNDDAWVCVCADGFSAWLR